MTVRSILLLGEIRVARRQRVRTARKRRPIRSRRERPPHVVLLRVAPLPLHPLRLLARRLLLLLLLEPLPELLLLLTVELERIVMSRHLLLRRRGLRTEGGCGWADRRVRVALLK